MILPFSALFLPKDVYLLQQFIYIALLLFISSNPLSAQEITLQLNPSGLQNAFNLPETQPNAQEAKILLSQKVDSLRQKGYLTCSIDSTVLKNNTLHIFAFLGKKYKIDILSKGNVDDQIFHQLFQDKGSIENWNQFERKQKELINYYVDAGFINAKLHIQDVDLQKDHISAALHLEPGLQYVLDSIALVGNIKLNKEYLLTVLDTKQGAILNGEFFTQLTERIESSIFMKMDKAPAFRLQDDGSAVVFLDINEKKANEFDLLLGFLPNPNLQLTNRKLLITGEGTLHLFNPFGTGKEFSVDYKQLKPESPRLTSSIYIPQILKQPYGVEGSFQLIKEDTSFIQLQGEMGIRYPFGGNKALSLTYLRGKSYLQKVDTNYVKQTLSLPKTIDYTQNIYQMGFMWNKRNRNRNPSKGLYINTKLGLGNREIVPNEAVLSLNDTTFNFAGLYNGLNDDKLVLKGDVKGQYYFPLKERTTVLLQNQTGLLQVNRFFENELYRLGGIQTIRGFDEQSYFASSYSISTVEYRYLLNRDSYFAIFGDWAIVENKQKLSDQQNNLFGIGSGLNLATQAGIFSVNLAVGKDDQSTFDFNRTRVHIGYVNVF